MGGIFLTHTVESVHGTVRMDYQ